nr:hypothetical protein [Pseudomonas sp. PDM26]
MNVNDDVGILYARVALVFIASELAPTGIEAGRAYAYTIGQHSGAGQAFRRYNARLDRDKPD